MRSMPQAGKAGTATPVAPDTSPAAPARSTGGGAVADALLGDPVAAGVLYSAWSGDPVTVCPAPPGSGKSRLVSLLAASLADSAGLRVAVAAQTREQAAEVARRVGALTGSAVLAWGARGQTPDVGASRARLAQRAHEVRFPTRGGGVLIATTARWLYLKPDQVSADVMLVDEAWQATYSDVGALGAFAPQIVLVGDPGQIAPVVTGSTRRWADSPTGPHLPAPDALMAAHGDAVSVVRLKHTYRLGPETTALIQPAFYPDLPFTSRRPAEHVTDAAGEALPEIAMSTHPASAGVTDPGVMSACADRVRGLLGASLTTAEGTRPMTEGDVLVVVGHVQQAAAVRALLADHPGVLVGTANAVQGMERAAAVVLHPLTGYRDVATFGTDPGRTCVMLSRHRAHLHVIADTHTATLLRNAEPTPATTVQRRIFDALSHPREVNNHA